MKQLFLTAAIVLAGATIVGCSGNASDSDIESKAAEFVERMSDAAQKGDFEAIKQVKKEQQEWYDSFSKEDQIKAAEALNNAQKAARNK